MNPLTKIAHEAPAMLLEGARLTRKLAQENVDLSAENDAVKHELTVHKLAYPIRDFQEGFHYSMHKLSHAVHHHDPHYLKNVSIANLFINGTRVYRETERLNDGAAVMIKQMEQLEKAVKQFNETRKAKTEERSIMSKLEENQLNLVKIIENVNSMEGLFETVRAEMERVGDISRAMRNLKEVERELGVFGRVVHVGGYTEMIEKVRGVGLALVATDVHKLAEQVREATESATADRDADRFLELLRLLCIATLAVMAVLLWAVLRRLGRRLSPLYQTVRSE